MWVRFLPGAHMDNTQLDIRLKNIEDRIERIYKKVDSMHKAQERAAALSWLKWIIIISIFLIIASYARPYIKQVFNMYSSILNMSSELTNLEEISELIKISQ